MLTLLSDGGFQSGESLAAELGISRAAVWKRIGRLDELGLHVERRSGRGYRLEGGIELLDGERIGVTVSDEWQLHPEQSTSAIVVLNPRAKYFTV